MLNGLNIVLILCLIACLIYIYWLHNGDIKVIKKRKSQEQEYDDDMSFLKSNYEPTESTGELLGSLE